MTTAYRVQLDVYGGPLDLLVHLVRQDEVDALELTIAEICSQYLAYLENLQAVDVDEAGEFLVLSSHLLEVKSRALLPRAEETAPEEEDETRQELVKQLLEYRRFKEAGAMLWERARAQQQKLSRQQNDLPAMQSDPGARPIRELELWDLVSAFSRILKENIVPVTDTIKIDTTPIEVYMAKHEKRVLETGGITFAELIGTTNTRSQVIGKFLALLELIKMKKVWFEMTDAYEISIYPPRPLVPLTDQERAEPMADATEPPPQQPSRDDHEASVADASDQTSEAADASPSAPQAPADPANAAWEDFEPVSLEEGSDETLPSANDLDGAWSDFEHAEELPKPEGVVDDPDLDAIEDAHGREPVEDDLGPETESDQTEPPQAD
ncbi:Segregation and condensation protein A [Planctomycetes bacterium Pan216]|uniref:Segregation and condensation protein A n=1 Tax=Kolteria novifilia TaxID=2527975 RepID=A0A518BBW3_9BACT|nr:Segregation and condensation protein A [Planctomycetes bacterium Pan216]